MIFAQEDSSQNKGIHYQVTIANRSGGEITKNEILNAGKLDLESTSGINLASFKMTVVYKNGPIEFSNEMNGFLTDEMRKAIVDAYPGCNVFLEFIKARNENGAIVTLAPISLKIMD